MRRLIWRLPWTVQKWGPFVDGHFMHPLDYIAFLWRSVGHWLRPTPDPPPYVKGPKRWEIVPIVDDGIPPGTSIDWAYPDGYEKWKAANGKPR